LHADLPTYLDAVARGETVVVCKDNQPVAELRPVRAAGTPRPIELARGLIEIHPNAFDPLPDDLLSAFEGKQE
jgi:antitoxin (DNA-binding transcriptional repressor) of toxin-antitoxin stability system